ncbi:MAG: PIN domain-containing protein, partial [Candidatus Binatia bacterium]
MIRAVLDTNTLVSALGWPDSVPGEVWRLASAKTFALVTSEVLLDELGRVLAYPKL